MAIGHNPLFHHLTSKDGGNARLMSGTSRTLATGDTSCTPEVRA